MKELFLKISEIFYSIQGEGAYAGTPSVFIRVGGCNLKCPAFGENGCDSFYAVDRNYEKEWKNFSVDELINEVLKYPKESDIVVTGGEPTLFYKEFYSFIEFFGDRRVTFETNVTILIDFDKYPLYKNVTFAMSVKLSNSGEDYSKRVIKKSIRNLIKNSKNSFFKFVIDRDLNDEIIDIVGDSKVDIYCMPLGESEKELKENAKFTFEFCLKYGYKYSDRIHIRIFNKKKGV